MLFRPRLFLPFGDSSELGGRPFVRHLTHLTQLTQLTLSTLYHLFSLDNIFILSLESTILFINSYQLLRLMKFSVSFDYGVILLIFLYLLNLFGYYEKKQRLGCFYNRLLLLLLLCV